MCYDTHYRVNAAATGNRQWSHLDIDLYTRPFMGRAKTVASCEFCDSTFHSIEQCPLKSLRTKLARRPASGPVPSRKCKWSGDVCFGYNASGDSSYKAACKFCHVCGTCGGKHPAKSCSKGWFQLLAYMQMLLGSSVIKYDHAGCCYLTYSSSLSFWVVPMSPLYHLHRSFSFVLACVYGNTSLAFFLNIY